MTGQELDFNANGLPRLLRAPSLASLREDLLAQEPPLNYGELKALAILGAGPEGAVRRHLPSARHRDRRRL